jgi:hypothetical protein
MLKVAAAALDDAAHGRSEPPNADHPTTGVFVGLGLDPNTTNYNLRWSLLANGRRQPAGDGEETHQPADAGRSPGDDMRSAVTVSLVPEARGGPFVFWDDLPAACAKAAKLGFDAIELFPPGPDAVDPAELRTLLDDNGLSLAAMGTGATVSASADTTERFSLVSRQWITGGTHARTTIAAIPSHLAAA